MSYFINFSYLLKNRDFRFLYTGQFVSFFGTMITSVAVPFQIYHETHSTVMIGLVSLCQLIPLLFTALIGGVFADKHHRIQLLLITESMLAMGSLTLAYNASLAKPQVWLIFVVAVLMSAINGLHRPALDSATQQLVERKDFPIVGPLNSLIFSVSTIGGPAVGGLLIAKFGIASTFLIDFVTFVISLTTLFFIHEIPKPVRMVDESTLTSLLTGLKYAFSRQELLGSYFVDFFAMIFGMPMALFPAIAHAHGGVKMLGLLYSAPAVGALIISFVSGWVDKIERYGVAIAYSAMAWGVAIILFGFTYDHMLGLFFLAVAGAFDAVSGIFRQTLWNQTVPNELRGRLAGIEMISYLSGPKLGDTEAALVAAAFGISFSIISGGVLCIAAVAVSCYYLPKFWNYKS